jgi:hypothetical protein
MAVEWKFGRAPSGKFAGDRDDLDRAQANALARTAWLIVGLLVPVALLNYLDRQMLAAMKSSTRPGKSGEGYLD